MYPAKELGIIEGIVAKFQDELQDGFQMEDITRTVEWGAKRVVRGVLEVIPGETGAAKAAWCKETLKNAWRLLVGRARELFASGILSWAGYVLEDMVRRIGEGAIDWLVDNLLDVIIKWAYADQVLRQKVASQNFQAALEGARSAI